MKIKSLISCCLPVVKSSSQICTLSDNNCLSGKGILNVDIMSVNTVTSGKLSPDSECSISVFRRNSYSDPEVVDIERPQSYSTNCSGSVHSDFSTDHPFAPKSNEALCGSVIRLKKDRDRIVQDLCVLGKSISPRVSGNRLSSVTSAPEQDCGYSFTPYPTEYGDPRFGKMDLTRVDSGEDLRSTSTASNSSSNLSTVFTENISTHSSSQKSLASVGLSIKSLEGGSSLTSNIQSVHSMRQMKCPAATVQGHCLMAGDLIITDLDDIDNEPPTPGKVMASPQTPPKSQDLVTIVRGTMKPTSSFPFRREKPVVAWGDKVGIDDEKPVQASESSLVRRLRGAFGKRRVERPKGAKQRDISQTSTTVTQIKSRK